jgi:hypothetical protein
MNYSTTNDDENCEKKTWSKMPSSTAFESFESAPLEACLATTSYAHFEIQHTNLVLFVRTEAKALEKKIRFFGFFKGTYLGFFKVV